MFGSWAMSLVDNSKNNVVQSLCWLEYLYNVHTSCDWWASHCWFPLEFQHCSHYSCLRVALNNMFAISTNPCSVPFIQARYVGNSRLFDVLLGSNMSWAWLMARALFPRHYNCFCLVLNIRVYFVSIFHKFFHKSFLHVWWDL